MNRKLNYLKCLPLLITKVIRTVMRFSPCAFQCSLYFAFSNKVCANTLNSAVADPTNFTMAKKKNHTNRKEQQKTKTENWTSSDVFFFIERVSTCLKEC